MYDFNDTEVGHKSNYKVREQNFRAKNQSEV